MAMKKSEWLGVIKPILDRDAAKSDAVELAKELGDILEINIDANPENLKQLTNEFNQQLVKIGKQPIVFSEKTLRGIVSQFATAITAGFTKGANTGVSESLKLQLDALRKQKEALIKEQNEINKNMINQERMKRIGGFNIDTAHSIKVDGDIVKEAARLLDELHEYGDKIIDADKSAPDYTQLVLDAQEKYNYYLRMQKTLKNFKGSLPKDLKASYDLFRGNERDAYELDGGEYIPFEESFQADAIFEAFDGLSDSFIDAKDRLSEIKTTLSDIDTQIAGISSRIREVGNSDGGIFDEAENGLKTLNEIEDAYKRILNRKVIGGEQRANKKEIDKIQSAINFDPSQNNKGIKTLYQEYQDALASGDWTQEYQALLKYVKLYESYLASDNEAHRKKAGHAEYKELYARLKPLAANAQNMLQNIINMDNNIPLVGMGGAEQKAPVEATNDALSQQKDSLTEIERLTSYIDEHYLSAGKHLSDFLNDVKSESNELDGELKEILTTLNLIDDSGNLKFDIKHSGEDGSGTTHNGALISDDFVIIERAQYEQVKSSNMPGATKDAATGGINVAKILGYLPSKYSGGFFDIQDKAKGHNLFENGVLSQDVVNATDEQLEQLVQAFIKARDYGFDIENGGSNIVYDKERGFSFYDLDELPEDDAEYWNSLSESEKKLNALENLFSLFSGINRDHTNFAGDTNVHSFVERIKQLIANKNIITPDALDGDGRNYEDIFDDVFSGDVDSESDDLMARLREEAELRQKVAEAANEEKLAKEEQVTDDQSNTTISLLEKEKVAYEDILALIKERHANLSNEHMSLMGADGQVSTVGGDEYTVDTDTLVRQLIDNLRNSILMSLHNHPDGMLAFTPSDIRSYGGLFKGQGIDVHGIIADGIIKTIDFSNVSQEVILQVARSFAENLSTASQLSGGLFSYQDEEIILSDDIKALMNNSPEDYEATKNTLIKLIDNALKTALKDNGVESAVQTFTDEQLPQLAEYLSQIQQRAQEAVNPIEKLQRLMPIINSTKGLRDVDDVVVLEETLAKRREMFDLLQREGLLTDEMKANYDAVNVELHERINLLKQSNDSAYTANNSIKDTDYSAQRVGGASDTGDASSVDLEAERTKNEALQTELAQKNQQLADKDAEIQAANLEKSTLQSDLEIANQQLKIAQDGEVNARARAYESEVAVSEKDEIIQGLREQLANIDTGTTPDNTVAIDETSLETILNRVFANILNPQGNNEPWALESTLNTTIKGVLDNIQMNTSKLGDSAGASMNDDAAGKLAEIKSVLDSINGKVVKGVTSKPGSQSKAPAPKRTNTQSAVATLIKDYEKLGQLRAQFEKDGNLETKAQLQNLAAEVDRKKESLNLTIEETMELRKRSNIAYESERRLLDAAEKQKKIEEEQKAAVKAANAQQKADVKEQNKKLANAKKMAQREAMLGKAGNAVGRAENTWMSAAGLDGEFSTSFVAQIDEYYNKLDALRKKHNELKNSDMISEEQKNDLIAQTTSVNKLTAEIGELVAEHQRLSGDNATVIGTNALGSDAGLAAYKQQLQQAVMVATNGKAQIKGFDATTKTLNYTVKTGAHEFTEYSAAVRRTDSALVSVQGATKRTETFIEATMRKMKEISSYMSGMSLLSRAGQELRKGIQYVREIDSALTELKKVTDATEESYDKFLDTAAKTADKVGSTIKDVVSSTADWARLNI